MAWSELLVDVLEMITKRLTVGDYVRFRAVCKSWRSAVGVRPHHLPCQLPWLMQSYEGESDIRCFYSILEDKVYRIKMPNSREERCVGSSHGWLAMVGMSPAIRLLNPLTGDEIQLPPMTTFPGVILEFRPSAAEKEYAFEFQPSPFDDNFDKEWDSLEYGKLHFIEKIVLSSNPTSNGNCVVLAYLYRFGRLVFCRPGDQTWTMVEGSIRHYRDLVCYNGQFVAICHDGNLYLIDVVGPSLSMKLVWKLPLETRIWQANLVELAGELLVVLRNMDEDDSSDSDIHFCYWTLDFTPYKVAFDSQPVKWSQLESIGNHALFLGATNSSLSHSLDGVPGFNEDSVYFTEDYMSSMICEFGFHDVGIYNMKNKRMEALPCYRNTSTEALLSRGRNIFTSQCIWPPPTWITPSLC